MRTRWRRSTALLGLLSAAALWAQVPLEEVPSLPETLRPDDRHTLAARRERLLKWRANLLAELEEHNRHCRRVERESSAAAECRIARDRLLAQIDPYRKARFELLDDLNMAAQLAAQTFFTVGALTGDVTFVYPDGKQVKLTESGQRVPFPLGGRVVSGPTARLQVMFPDETVCTIGPNADLIFDDFVYQAEERLAVEVVKGRFQFVTGRLAAKDPVTIRIKWGSFGGFRGTGLEVELAADGSGWASVLDGELDYRDRNDRLVMTLREGDTISFDERGQISRLPGAATQTRPRPPG